MTLATIFADSVPPVSGGIPYLSDDDSNIFLFHIGIPNPGTFPRSLFAGAISDEQFNWDEAMQYSPVVGDLEAREGIAALYKHRGETARLDELMLTAGIAEAFDILPQLFINPGDVIFTEDPSYPWGIRSFKIHRAEIRAIPTSKYGMDLEILEKEIIKAGKRAKMIYTMPVFHNPMGILVPEKYRQETGRLAEKYNLVIVEDDPYRELAFEEKAPISLRHTYPERVINLGTFSKSIGGGVRQGWIWAEPALINQMTQIKHTGTTTFTARATGKVLMKPAFYQHLDRCASHYKKRRDITRKALLDSGLESWIKYDTQGGFYFWLRIPDTIDAPLFLKKAFDNGLYILAGNHFSDNAELQRYFRLSFSFEAEEKMVEGISQLARLAQNTI